MRRFESLAGGIAASWTRPPVARLVGDLSPLCIVTDGGPAANLDDHANLAIIWRQFSCAGELLPNQIRPPWPRPRHRKCHHHLRCPLQPTAGCRHSPWCSHRTCSCPSAPPTSSTLLHVRPDVRKELFGDCDVIRTRAMCPELPNGTKRVGHVTIWTCWTCQTSSYHWSRRLLSGRMFSTCSMDDAGQGLTLSQCCFHLSTRPVCEGEPLLFLSLLLQFVEEISLRGTVLRSVLSQLRVPLETSTSPSWGSHGHGQPYSWKENPW